MESQATVFAPLFNPVLRRHEILIDADPEVVAQFANLPGLAHVAGNQFVVKPGHNRDIVFENAKRKLAEITGNGESAAS